MKNDSEAQDPTHSLRPTLIHIHDYNALCSDDCDVMKKIFLWTNSLRSDPCRVSVIGTCSISRAPQRRFREPDSLSTGKSRVISLPISLPELDSQALEERESLVSNAEMISKLIVRLHEPPDVDSRLRAREYESAIVERFGSCTLLVKVCCPWS